MMLRAPGAGGLLCLLAVTLAGCDNLPGKPRKDERPIPADQVLDFPTLYQTNCAACHGAKGQLGPAPPLNDPLFLALVSEKEIQNILVKGRPGTAMASFAANKDLTQGSVAKAPVIASSPTALTPQQIEILARGIKKEWPAEKETSGLPPYRSPGAKVSASEEKAAAQRGKTVFQQACAVCHGPDGKEPKLVINDPNFLALISDQALRRIIITGRPDLGMPNYRAKADRGADFKPLTSQQIDDLLAYLVSWRQGSGQGK